jgi:hypothetical protein
VARCDPLFPEEAEPLYKRALDILQRTFPNGHPNIDACENDYAIMKQKKGLGSELENEIW